ncbi:DUF4279 domain-containing protein [Shimazuella kribbensis]|uniref:DUF4279 domain-containing protein n=1 Tax=Shimazuella kribbensis TaxID=139808 RepID=UPI000428640F|nr:DUF4279 domain-containing protein [Shimazuella kribbensis]
MKKTTVMVEFAIFGDDFSPDAVTEKLSTKPTKCWMKGESIRDMAIVRKETNWSISTGYEESWDINDQLKKLVELLENKRSDLKELKRIYNLEYKFFIVINVENNEKPAIYLENDMIEFANDIKAWFDFDLCIFS